MQNFDYDVPTKIFFGNGKIANLGKEILKYGNNVLLTYGGGSIKKNGIYNDVINQLNQFNINYVELSDIKPNPSIESVKQGIDICRKNKIDFILAVGGGSVIDCSKAISAGVGYDGDPWDFFDTGAKVQEVIPIGTVLTLAATGSEMNGNAVISNDKVEQKLPLGHVKLKPRFSILDPVYSYSVSKFQTAAGTADIMSHCFEQYFSKAEGTFVQDRMTEAIIKTCIHYGPIALKETRNYEARANLMWASSLALNGVLQYGKEGDWATHTIEHKISAISDLTHGIGLAMITPHWMKQVLDENSIEKFVSFAKNVFDIPDEDNQFEIALAGINALSAFFRSMDIPMNLKSLNIHIEKEKLVSMAADIVKNGDIGKFKKLGYEEVHRIIQAIN